MNIHTMIVISIHKYIQKNIIMFTPVACACIGESIYRERDGGGGGGGERESE